MPESLANHWWLIRTFGKQRYLLLALVALLVLLPVLVEYLRSPIWSSILLTAVVVTGPLSLARTPFAFYAALVLGSMMVGMRWVDPQRQIESIIVIRDCATVLFFLLLSVMIFYEYLLRNRRVTVETLFAAVNAYLCIGIMYAFGYFFVLEVAPEAFRGELLETPSFDVCVYLSFVTMTTLGYGDITPKTNIAAMLTWTQAVFGQLYIALTIARVVSSMSSSDER